MTPRQPDELAVELVTHLLARRGDEASEVIASLSVNGLAEVLFEALGLAELLGFTASILTISDDAERLLQRAAASYLAAGLVEGPA